MTTFAERRRAIQDPDITIEPTLREGAHALGVPLSPQQLRQFARYEALLREWNARMNLTRVRPEDVVPLHFLDSLAVCRAIDLSAVRTLIDVGTGAGFPGLALKIAFPALSVVLLDSTRKRLDFLRAVLQEIGITDVELVHARAEEAGRDPAHRRAYDVVTARAVAPMERLLEWLAPFVRPGGAALALKSAGADEEIAGSMETATRLALQLERVVSVMLPGTDIERKIAVVRRGSAAGPRHRLPRDRSR